MSLFVFCQNNTGGRFIPPAICVFVEADTAEEANDIAQTAGGVYFHGVKSGKDCDCCGDRWYPVDDPLDLTEYPQNDPIAYYGEMYEMWAEDDLLPAVLLIGKE